MGEQNIKYELDGETRRFFTKRLLTDLRALDQMIRQGVFEKGITRIGAEQEMFIVERGWWPSTKAVEILDRINDPHFTTELALFNLEANLDPYEFTGDCLSVMEKQLLELVEKARKTAAELDVEVILTGILPTIRKGDLGLDNLTPKPRYFALNRVLSQMRGGDYDFYIRGLDELSLRHDSMMVEACNTSFQVHMQVAPEDFARYYNIAQIATAPVLAAATNSPLLLGRRLWHETRIALFQQAIDTRVSSHNLRERSPRVTFGTQWVKNSVLELYFEDIARFRSLLDSELQENPFELLEKGEMPQLYALKLHNGTVYRWNRACYGITNGIPHLRIENRVLPSGPTPRDEIANATFWLGLVKGLALRNEDITRRMSFEDATTNFYSAARLGLYAQFSWLEHKRVPAQTLICDTLLPIAEEGLQKVGVRQEDIDLYLGVIDKRVRTGQNGSEWMLTSMAAMRHRSSMGEKLNALTAGIIARQKENKPVAEWEPVRLEEAGREKHNYLRVEQYMTTDLFTVQEDELVDMVASLMDWARIRHVPVEDQESRLVGLVSYRALLRLMARGWRTADGEMLPVSEIMNKNLVTVTPETMTMDAIELMRKHRISCLPVVRDGRLVGVVTERDFMNVTAGLLEEKLKES
ncbi:MAG: CBS domain-containing protein [Blastocatellia bacterium]|nr:CBS domain-containing protein [Blastocatellia bacterium]